MDPSLMLEGVDHIKEGKLTMSQLLKMAITFEQKIAEVGALCTCILDGTVYTKNDGQEKATVSELKHFAELHFVLRTMRDAAKDIKKFADKALDGTDERAGNDGHTQRFAERLRESGLSKFKIDELGSFFIKSKTIAIPPSKKALADIEAFTNICMSCGLDLDKPEATLKAAETIAQEKGVKVPDYVKFKLYLRSVNLAQESWNWGAFQKHVQEMNDNDREIPDFIRVTKREEVQFRKA